MSEVKDLQDKIKIINNKTTPSHIIEQIFSGNEEHRSLYSPILHNENTPAAVLSAIYNKLVTLQPLDDEIPEKGLIHHLQRNKTEYLSVIATHQNTPMEIFTQLSHSVPRVRAALARNPKVDPHLLESILPNADFNTKIGLAINPSCPPEVIQSLAQENWDIKKWLAQNNSTPNEILTELMSEADLQKNSENIKIAIVDHPNYKNKI